jgi:hypothetical protein
MRVDRRVPFVAFALLACTTQDVGEREQPKKAPESSEPQATVEPPAVTKPSAPTPPAPTPPAPPPDLATIAAAAAGPGFTVGPPPKFAAPPRADARASHASAKVLAYAHLPESENFDTKSVLQLRVEFAALDDEAYGLNYLGGGGDNSCDDLWAEVQQIASFDDGRWLLDAQMACRNGADYFRATNDHTLLLIDLQRPRAEVLWTGVDKGRSAMGVCVSSSVTNFDVEGDAVRISKTEITTLDREAAKELTAAAEDCDPKPEQTTDVARIELTRKP